MKEPLSFMIRAGAIIKMYFFMMKYYITGGAWKSPLFDILIDPAEQGKLVLCKEDKAMTCGLYEEVTDHVFEDELEDRDCLWEADYEGMRQQFKNKYDKYDDSIGND